MADRNHLRIADVNESVDDDPFAELTRIMGFDPRVSAEQRREQEPEVASAQQAVPVQSDQQDADFSIDLEKELMGEFDNEIELETAFSDADFDLPLDYDAVAASEASPEPSVAESTVDVNLEAAFEHEFDSGYDDFLEPESAAAHVVFQPVAPVVSQVPDAMSVTPDVLPHDDFDHAFEASFDGDLSLDADDLMAAELSSPVQPMAEPEDLIAEDIFFDDALFGAEDGASSHAVAVAPVPAHVDEAAALDVSLADVDMDFSELFEPETPELAAAYVAPAPYMAEPEMAAVAFDDTHIEAGLDEEISLEDELNALLAKPAAPIRPMSRVNPVAYAAPVRVTPPAYVAPAVEEVDPLAGFVDDVETSVAAEDSNRWSGLEQDFSYEPAAIARHDAAYAADVSRQHEADAGGGEWSEDDFSARESENVHAAAAADFDVPEFDDAAFDIALDDEYAPQVAVEPEVEDDPFAMLKAMVTKPGSNQYFGEEAPAPAPTPHTYSSRPPAYSVADDMPEIETVDVPEAAVAFADDLEIPELAYEEDLPVAAGYSDYESEFSTTYNELSARSANEEPVTYSAEAASRRGAERGEFDDFYAEPRRADVNQGYGYAAAGAAASTFAAAAPSAYGNARSQADNRQFDADDRDFGDDDFAVQADARGNSEFGDLDYDPDLDEEMSIPAYGAAESQRRPQPSRTLLIAGIVAGVAVIGGIGAFALSFGNGTGSDVPTVVRADEGPIKIKPANPGGIVVPNQDNKVYDTVGRVPASQSPVQEKLVTTSEEPVDMEAVAPAPRIIDQNVAADNTMTPKGEDRIDPLDAEQAAIDTTETVAVAPRRVRTMVVKPDGTLVAREEPAPVVTAPVATGADAKPLAPANEETAALPAANAAEPSFKSPGAETAVPVAAPKPAVKAAAPVVAPVAEQPVDTVGTVNPDQVAAVNVEPSAANGAWSMQIASQPSAEAAQSTYDDLARKYGGVIAGRGVNIVKAEIAGKGTFYRVRIPAQTRNDAIELCNSYKSAGGNCFVSK